MSQCLNKLSTARGCLYGVLCGALMWALSIGIILVVIHFIS